MKRSKKYNKLAENIDKNKEYSITEALKLLQKNKSDNFDESIEIHIKTTIALKKSDQQVRGSVVLPHGTGKSKKIAVITSTKATEAKKANADIILSEEDIAKIKNGKVSFDVLIATPEMMPKLAPIAKILGPKGLMPNPKTDTVTEKIEEAIAGFKKGKINFKNDKTGNVHQIIGKISFDISKLEENFATLIKAIRKNKSDSIKGDLFKKITICSTMSPSLKIQIS